MALDHPSLLESNQMRYVADSLKPVGSRLENEISYEINGISPDHPNYPKNFFQTLLLLLFYFFSNLNLSILGCMLTWIANYCGSEFRFDCSNIIEIIDGYYKAEFYLDTKKLLDTTDALNSSCDTSDIVFTDYVSDETGKNISNSQTSKDYRKIDSISNASTEVDSLNEINSINTNGNEPEVAENKITKVENKEPDLEQTLPEKPNNQIEKPKDKVSTPQKKPVQAQVPPSQGFNLRSSRTNRNITSPNYFNKDDSRSFNCYSRIHSKPEITFTPEVKRRRNSKSVPHLLIYLVVRTIEITNKTQIN